MAQNVNGKRKKCLLALENNYFGAMTNAAVMNENTVILDHDEDMAAPINQKNRKDGHTIESILNDKELSNQMENDKIGDSNMQDNKNEDGDKKDVVESNIDSLSKDIETKNGSQMLDIDESTNSKRGLSEINNNNNGDNNEIVTPPPRPVKKSRTAYFIFADDQRCEFKKSGVDHGSMASTARHIGQLWSNINEEEKEQYKLLAAEEKQAMLDQIESLRASGHLPDKKESQGSTHVDAYDLQIPNGKIKKIVKLDPELKIISKEAVILLTKSCELFTCKLAADSNRVAQIQNRRTILLDDIVEMCSSREQILFLKDDIKDLKLELLNKKKAEKASAVDANHTIEKKGAIHNYFSTLS